MESYMFLVVLLLPFISSASGDARKLAIVQDPAITLKYHNGHLLKGRYTLNLLWYGRFTPSQRAIVTDFLRSLAAPDASPSVSSWWHTTSSYRGGRGPTTLSLGRQLFDKRSSLGKSLKSSDVATLARKAASGPNSISVVFTAADVAVEGFCSSRCATHAPLPGAASYLWVGNSATQCPGQCAWPFRQPMYGPQTPPLVAPNGDTGADGIVINLATVLAGAVTNPDGRGYFQGPALAPREAVTACTGKFGKGAYPGYAGQVLVDQASGASYNAHGLNGRKYLLPAMWDPRTSQCSTLV